MGLRTVGAMLLGLGVLCEYAAAETIVVPDDQPTIQAAVDAADPGDVIQVKAGTYSENVVIAKSNLTLRGKGRAILDASGSLEPGILVNGQTGVTIEKLRIVDAGRNGIRFEGGSGCGVLRCVIERSANHAVSAGGGGSGHLFERNTISGNVGDGFDLGDDVDGVVDNCTISKNKITGGDDGVDGHGSGHVIVKNRIQGVDCIGIKTGAGGTGTTVERNKLTDIGETAFLVRGDNMIFIKNRVKNCGEDGAFVNGSGHSFEKDRFQTLGDDGITLESDTANVTVTGVKIKGAADDAFECEGTGHTFTKCQAKKTGETAFRIKGTGVTVQQCKAKKSGEDDLLDDAAAGVNTFTGNKFDADKVTVGPD